MELKARPKLGEREVTLVHVTEWIEKKLEQELQVKLSCFFPQSLRAPSGLEDLDFIWVQILCSGVGLMF